MTGKVVTQYSTHEILQNGTIRSLAEPGTEEPDVQYTNLQVATTVTFAVAIIQVSF